MSELGGRLGVARLQGTIQIGEQRLAVPGKVLNQLAAEFRIDAPEPRSEEFRTSADYAGLCRKVSAALAPAYEGQRA